MRPLFEIPNEIITHILTLVPEPDLLNLCLVNKFFRHCVEPILYYTIRSHWTDERVPPIVNLLHTLLRRPCLFTYIDTLILEGDESFGKSLGNPGMRATGEFVPIIRKFKLPFTDRWVGKLWAGDLDAFAALLIANLSNIRRLALTHIFVRHHDITGQVLQAKVSGQLHMLQRLETMGYIHGDYFMTAPKERSKEGIALFYLPMITRLAVWIRNPEFFHWPSGRPDLDHMTSLDVEGCCATFMAEILAATRNLGSLSWVWYYSPDTGDRWITGYLDLDELISALSPVRGTLTKSQFRLAISSDRWPPDAEPEIGIDGSFSGLDKFDGITHLSVPIVFLVGFEFEPQPLDYHIPHNVEVISLSSAMLYGDAIQWTRDDSWPDEDIMKMLQNLNKRYLAEVPTATSYQRH